MNSLPVIHRELREASRRSVTWRIRTAIVAGGVVVSVFFMVMFATTGVPPASWGLSLFCALASMMGIYAAFAGPILAADCLSSEKREGTLGLLFLTDLKPLDVVLGKLAGRAIGGIYALVGMVPLLALVLLLGGVTWTMILMTVLALFNGLFFSLAVSVFVSAMSIEERISTVFSMLTLVVCLLGPVMAVTLHGSNANWRTPAEVELMFRWLGLSLAFPLIGAMGMGLPGLPMGVIRSTFWFSIAFYQLLGWLCLILSGSVLTQVRQEKTPRKGTGGWRTLLHRWKYGWPEERRQHRAHWLDRNAFAWLSLRDIRRRLLAWLLVAGLGFGFWLGVYNAGGLSLILTRDILLGWGVMVVFLLKIWWATEAARVFTEERRGGTYELLLTTRLETSEIIRGQWRALGHQFLWPTLFLLAALAFLWSRLPDTPWIRDGLVALVSTAIDLWALGWMAMWRGARSTGLNRAIGQSLFFVLVVPILILMMCMGTLALVKYLAELGLLGTVSPASMTVPDAVATVAAQLWCWSWALAAGFLARRQVMHRFRELATAPVGVRFIRRWRDL